MYSFEESCNIVKTASVQSEKTSKVVYCARKVWSRLFKVESNFSNRNVKKTDTKN